MVVGAVEVVERGRGGQQRSRRMLKRGAVLGRTALLFGQRHGVSARTCDPCVLLTVSYLSGIEIFRPEYAREQSEAVGLIRAGGSGLVAMSDTILRWLFQHMQLMRYEPNTELRPSADPMLYIVKVKDEPAPAARLHVLQHYSSLNLQCCHSHSLLAVD